MSLFLFFNFIYMQKTNVKTEKINNFRHFLSTLNEEQKNKSIDNFQAISIEGKVYSGFNRCFLAYQKAPVGIFGGFKQWQFAKKKVKKGSKAFYIFFPSKKQNDEDDEDIRFWAGAIFHESQTEPA